MDAKELMVKSEAHDEHYVGSGIWFCGKCRILYHEKMLPVNKDLTVQEAAERCCKPRICSCGKTIDDGKYGSGGWTICEDCRQKKQEEKEQAAWDKAELVEKYPGYEGMFYDGDDRYYSTVEEALDDLMTEDDSPPEFLFMTKPAHPMKIDIEWLYEHISENAEIDDFDCREHMVGMDEFEAAVEKFNEANKAVVIGWYPDYSRKVRGPEMEDDEEETHPCCKQCTEAAEIAKELGGLNDA
jgi:hypothetical protein